ncbi:hypothetical protein B0H14DRAFT_2567746 [Mycena olivaceomarginata]|nr:hypothetical protein B0H14DRAFT_2567746 [Mycena olivaceomarginata]
MYLQFTRIYFFKKTPFHKAVKLTGTEIESKLREFYPKAILGHDSSTDEWIVKLMPSGAHDVAEPRSLDWRKKVLTICAGFDLRAFLNPDFAHLRHSSIPRNSMRKYNFRLGIGDIKVLRFYVICANLARSKNRPALRREHILDPRGKLGIELHTLRRFTVTIAYREAGQTRQPATWLLEQDCDGFYLQVGRDFILPSLQVAVKNSHFTPADIFSFFREAESLSGGIGGHRNFGDIANGHPYHFSYYE